MPPGLEVDGVPGDRARRRWPPGSVKVTVAWPLPAVADTPVGMPGTAAGVAAVDGAEAGPVPMALVAVTVNV